MKIVGPCSYVHKSAESEMDQDSLQKAKTLLNKDVPDFSYDVVKYNSLHNTYSFIQSPDFNTADEPTVGEAVTISLKSKKVILTSPKGQIYHHKWLMVSPNYKGFCVARSKMRSESYKDIPYDKKRAGWRSYWESTVIPMIKEKHGSTSRRL